MSWIGLHASPTMVLLKADPSMAGILSIFWPREDVRYPTAPQSDTLLSKRRNYSWGQLQFISAQWSLGAVRVISGEKLNLTVASVSSETGSQISPVAEPTF